MLFKSERTLVVPDTHVPFHDSASWLIMCEFARDFKPDLVVLLGDFLDFDYFSTFDFPVRRVTELPGDMKQSSELLSRLQSFSKVDTIHYLGGNHEHRFYKCVNKQLPALEGVLDFERMLHNKVLGTIKYYDYKTKIKVNDTFFTHDFKRYGKNAIRQSLEKYQVPFVQGHLHKAQTESIRVNGKVIRGHCAGWLGDPSKVTYKEPWDADMDYQLGFMYGEIDRLGRYELRHCTP